MSGIDILCLGEPLVEFNNTAGGNWVESIGGDVSNVAIAARRQDMRTAIATRVGADSFGALLQRRWTEERVDVSLVSVDEEAPTGIYFVRHGADGHSFEYRRKGSAASRLAPGLLPRDAIAASRVLHLSGITQAISESACEAAFAAIAIAREAGAKVSYDPNLRLRLWPLERARDVIHATMREVDVALPGLEDARLLTGLSTPEEIAGFYRDLGAEVVALTLGADGALVAFGDQVVHVPPRPARLIDATGAGDCFDGAFLSEWLRSGDPVAAGRYAVVAASLSVQGYGAVEPIPSRSEVEAAMKGEAAGSIPAASIATPQGGSPRLRIALVAHDARKDALVAWAERHAEALGACDIVATGTTGGRLLSALPTLSVERLMSGPLGGDQQIGALIAEGRLDALIFFTDPLSPMPHDVDVKALTRLAIVHDIPMACSEATANMLARHGFAAERQDRARARKPGPA